MFKNTVRRFASLAAAGIFLTTASGCSNGRLNFGSSEDTFKTSIEEPLDNKKAELEQAREEFLQKYILEDYTEGSFTPFNFFGIPESAYVQTSGHSLFDKSEIYLGNNVIDFDLLNRMFEQGKTDTDENSSYFSTSWLDTSINPDGKPRYHTREVDKTIIFPISSNEDIAMYRTHSDSGVTISIEKRVDGTSTTIRYITFSPNKEDKLVMSSDSITHLYRDNNGNASVTRESFELRQKDLEDGSTETRWKKKINIYLRYEGGNYTIYGPLNVYSLPEESYEIISNYDTENGIGKYENTFVIVDEASLEDIRLALFTGDFSQTASYFQSAIDEANLKPKTFQKEYQD